MTGYTTNSDANIRHVSVSDTLGVFGQQKPQQQAVQNSPRSLIGDLSNGKVNTQPVMAKQVPVDPGKPNAQAAAQQQQSAAVAANKENLGKIAGAEKVLQEAKAEILAAAKSARVVDSLPNKSSSVTGVEVVAAASDFGMSTVAAAAYGKGSFITKGASAADTGLQIKGMAESGHTPEQALSAIQDVLTQSAMASKGDAMSADDFGTIKQAGTHDNVQVARPWDQIIEAHGPQVIAQVLMYDSQNHAGIKEMDDLYSAVQQNNAYEQLMKETMEKSREPGNPAAEQDFVDQAAGVQISLNDGFQGMVSSGFIQVPPELAAKVKGAGAPDFDREAELARMAQAAQAQYNNSPMMGA